MTLSKLLCLVVMTSFVAACTSDSVSSDDQAKRAYLGLDASIGKSITLGFAGFNSASSANISPQTTAGAVGGTLTITGQVDQGQSANKNMRLYVGMTAYTDGTQTVNDQTVAITYATNTDPTMQPYLAMMLSGIPTGTVTGTLAGVYDMTGDLVGQVTLNLAFDGTLEAGPNSTVVRTVGATTVTGTATSSDGTYNVMVTL
ncbi:MAG: hypothetical protein ABI591_14570 [Kofleriaceae bacterium]